MKPQKKSETLEVRLSHQDKTALQDKAAREGRTVSDVIRGLISSYLAQGEPRSKSSFFMELVKMLKSKPKSVFATLACLPLFAVPFLIPSTATAETFSLNLEGQYTVPEENGTRVRSAKMEVHMAPGDNIEFPFGSYDDNALNLFVSMSQKDDKLVLSFKLEDGTTTFATPTLLAELNEQTKIEINIDDGRAFTLTALPTQIDPNLD